MVGDTHDPPSGPPTLILPHLWLGDADDAARFEGARLSVHENFETVPARSHWMPYLVSWKDEDGTEQLEADPAMLDAAVAVIEFYQAHKVPLLVHCWAGIERSPLLVATYLIRSGRAKNYGDAYSHLRSLRPQVMDRTFWLPPELHPEDIPAGATPPERTSPRRPAWLVESLAHELRVSGEPPREDIDPALLALIEETRASLNDEMAFKASRWPELQGRWHSRGTAVREMLDDMQHHWHERTGLKDAKGNDIRVGDQATIQGSSRGSWDFGGPVGRLKDGTVCALDFEDFRPVDLAKAPQNARIVAGKWKQMEEPT